MTVPLRLGLFVLGLVAVFALAFGVGRLAGPAPPADERHELRPGPAATSGPGHVSEGGHTSEGGSTGDHR